MQIQSLLGYVVSALLYGLILVGIWLMVSKWILDGAKRSIGNMKFRNRGKKYQSKSAIYKHVERLVIITRNKKGSDVNVNFEVYSFFFVSTVAFVLAFLILAYQSSMLFRLFFSVGAAFVPYAYLRSKLQTIRILASHEGESVVAELLNQYKIQNQNIIEALDHSMIHLSNSPYSQRLLFRLSYQLKEYKSPDEMEKAIEDFVYAIDTEWVKMLAANIQVGLIADHDIVAGLDDIVKNLQDARRLEEQKKRLNREGFGLVNILSPALYVGSLYVAIYYFDFTIQKFFQYQFFTPTGLRYFALMIGGFLVNQFIYIAYKRQKFDF